MVYFCYSSSLNVCVAYIFLVLHSHLATVGKYCPFGFLLVMFPLGSSYFVIVFLSLWCLWWEVWDNGIDSWSLPSFLSSIFENEHVHHCKLGISIKIKNRKTNSAEPDETWNKNNWLQRYLLWYAELKRLYIGWEEFQWNRNNDENSILFQAPVIRSWLLFLTYNVFLCCC